MNRHERRKQKKNQSKNIFHKTLLKAIHLHSNKNYDEALNLYNNLLTVDPSNYDVLRHLGILFKIKGTMKKLTTFSKIY